MTLVAATAVVAAGWAAAQQSAPLSAIDWLQQNNPELRTAPQGIVEPPVTASGLSPAVAVAPLDDAGVRRLGLLPTEVTGFAPDLWTGSDPATLETLLNAALSQSLPAGQELLLRVLLAEADDPPRRDAATRWLLARLGGLEELGAVNPALALIEQAEPGRDPALFERWLSLALLAGREYLPCRVLVERPQLRPSEAARIFCTAQAGDFDTAALVYGTAAALDVLTDPQEALLARFLDPELFADEPLPTPPVRPDPLTFRLYKAAGEPLPTAPLPRAFAQTDLSDEAGWKAQIEAAERLARAGVLPADDLLELYTSRRPAASGGIWDRVAAAQALDRALSAQDAAAVSETLPPAWRSAQAGGIAHVFAELFAPRLDTLELDGPATEIARRMQYLALGNLPQPLPEDAPRGARFLDSIAQGRPDAELAETDAERRIAAAFAPRALPSPGLVHLPTTQRGEAVLQVLGRLARAGRGDARLLGQAVTDLRALGLGRVARRAALEYLLLVEAS